MDSMILSQRGKERRSLKKKVKKLLGRLKMVIKKTLKMMKQVKPSQLEILLRKSLRMRMSPHSCGHKLKSVKLPTCSSIRRLKTIQPKTLSSRQLSL